MSAGKGRIALNAFCGLVMVLLIAPALVAVPMSFNGRATFEFPPRSWSTRWYENLLSDVTWRDAIVHSLTVAAIVTVVATAIGTAAAYGLARGRFPGRAAVMALATAPMIIPIVLVAIALYAIFLEARMVGTLQAFVIAHSLIALPFVIVTVTAGLRSLDDGLERAARTLGAGPAVAFFTVTLPLLKRSLAIAAALAFAASLDDVVVAMFISSPTFQTLPVKIYSSLTDTVDPTVAVASTLTLSLAALGMAVAFLVMTKKGAAGDAASR
ncbi:ABC transporter permease [Conexibacter sp. JD483]|uniref:ABC transporter permease n=1 Tax=unclassified Conexibacter TaxID=2627773 RepID=UPI0027205EBA|nr:MULTISPECIES: ABC transporter permease [unclassified Conexibacter]MDO8187655.1 ABC transporter permease [Conexibacter sp. CPCC 205706]MDO8199840.1 ABC transporter permease [Conexibacter sp. CPCC 205762]MDR9370217.1 ABC transporter permease [Conexibacter sp. JD483]